MSLVPEPAEASWFWLLGGGLPCNLLPCATTPLLIGSISRRSISRSSIGRGEPESIISVMRQADGLQMILNWNGSFFTDPFTSKTTSQHLRKQDMVSLQLIPSCKLSWSNEHQHSIRSKTTLPGSGTTSRSGSLLEPAWEFYAADDSIDQMNSSRCQILSSDPGISSKMNLEGLQWEASPQDTACLADATIQHHSQTVCCRLQLHGDKRDCQSGYGRPSTQGWTALTKFTGLTPWSWQLGRAVGCARAAPAFRSLSWYFVLLCRGLTLAKFHHCWTISSGNSGKSTKPVQPCFHGPFSIKLRPFDPLRVVSVEFVTCIEHALVNTVLLHLLHLQLASESRAVV